MNITLNITLDRIEGMNVARERLLERLIEALTDEVGEVEVEFERMDGDSSFSLYEVSNVDEA